MSSSLERLMQEEERKIARVARNPGIPETFARKLDEEAASTIVDPITGRYTPPKRPLFGDGYDDPESLLEKVVKLPLSIGKSILQSVDIVPELHGGESIPFRSRAARIFNLATLPLPLAAPFKVAKGASIGAKALMAGAGSAVIGGTSAAIEGAPVVGRGVSGGILGAGLETGLSLLTRRRVQLKGAAAQADFFQPRPVTQAPDLTKWPGMGQPAAPLSNWPSMGQPKSPLSYPTRPKSFDNEEWALTPVTLTRPDKFLSREANIARKKAAENIFERAGQVFTKARGYRAGSTKPDAVAIMHGIDDVAALRQARDFDQDWVITKRGKYDLTNRTVQPITKVKFDNEVGPADDYVEMLVDGKLRKAAFEFGTPQPFNPRTMGQKSRFSNYINKADLDFLTEPSISAKMRLKVAQAVRYVHGTEAAERFLGAKEAGLDLPSEFARIDFTGNADDAVMHTGVNSLLDRTKKLYDKSLEQIINKQINGSEIDKFEEFLIAQYRLAADDAVKGVPIVPPMQLYPAFGQVPTQPVNLQNWPGFGKAVSTQTIGLDAVKRAELEDIIKNAPLNMRNAANDIYQWFDAHLVQLYEAKAITKDELDMIRVQTRGKYVPIRPADALQEDSLAEVLEFLGKPVKDAPAYKSPVQELIRDSYNFANIARRSMTSNALIAMLRQVGPDIAKDFAVPLSRPTLNMEQGLLDVLQSLKAPVQNVDNTIINGLDEAGERVWYRITDPSVAEMFKAMEPAQLGLYAKLFAPIASILRTGATLSLDFMAKNPIRDMFYGKVTSNTFMRDFVTNVASAFTKDEKYLQALRAGAFKAELLAQDVRVAENLVKRWTGTRNMGELVKDVIKSPLDGLQALSNSLERGTRLGAFHRRYAENIKKGMTPDRASRDAAIYAKDSIVDFSMYGSRTAPLRLTTAFWNAMIQSYDYTAKSFQRDPAGFMKRAVGYITVPSVLFYLNNRNDPEYKQLPSWERTMFWHIKEIPGTDIPIAGGNWVRIPKPFELGVVFGSSVERMLEALDAEDPRIVDAFAADYAKSAGFDFFPLPTAARPLLENYMNRSFLRQRPIVSKALEDVEAKYQTQPGTSGFAAFMGNMLNLSPVQIDNVIGGYTGGLGRAAIQTLATTKDLGQAVFDADKTIASSMPSFDPQTIFGLRAFLSQFPRNAEPIDKLYDFVDKARKASETSDYLEKSLRIDDLTDWVEQKAALAGVYPNLAPVTAMLSALRAQRSRIYMDESMSTKEQRRQMEELDRQMLDIASSVYDAVKQFDRPPQ